MAQKALSIEKNHRSDFIKINNYVLKDSVTRTKGEVRPEENMGKLHV